MHVDICNRDVVPVPTGGPTDKVVSSTTAAQSPTNSEAATMHHMNAAVLSNVIYPSARAAAIAKEAVDAAQLYYNLFFQASEESAAPVGTNAAQRRQRSSPQACPRKGAETAENDPAAGEKLLLYAASKEGVPQQQQSHQQLQRSGESWLHAGTDGSPCASPTSSTHSNETSLLSVQTPVNVVDTTYHTFFPPVLSGARREAIVERIVGHRPRPYYKWQWRKAEDYHALHAQNVHHNNVYQEYLSNVVAGGNNNLSGTGNKNTNTVSGAAGTLNTAANPAFGTLGAAAIESPIFTASSYPTVSPVVPVTGLNGRQASLDPAAASKSHVTADGDDCGAPPNGLPKAPSFPLNEMSFELMSQLSMYTIPTSQQGPEYFEKTLEDGTKTLIIFMMGLPARGKTFLAQKICRLLGWHGSRAKVQNIQVAWRRVLLDWEATHADHPVAQHGYFDVNGNGNCESCNSKHRTAPATAATPAAAVMSTTVVVPKICYTPTTVATATSDQCRRANALSGQHPANSSTQDEVSRVVHNLAAGSLRSSLRHPAATADSAGPANASGLPSTASTAQPTNIAESAVAAAAHGPARVVSLVCPSMEPYTALLTPTAHTAAASSTTALSDCASNVAVDGSPLDAALYVRPAKPPTHAAVSGTAAAAARESTDDAATAAAAAAPADKARPTMPAEVLRARHFKDLLLNPTSVARRLYRYVLQSFADDCRLFFQHGGEVVVINDDFVTEELRQEAEKLFRPLATQFFYMEVIRDAAEDPLDFVQCKIRDPMEYPRSDIDLSSATDDFNARLQFLESVYETLEGAPKTTTGQQPTHSCSSNSEQGTTNGLTGRAFSTPQLPRSYVKIRNANTIETHGISGYLASRIISYVMNLSQVKIQHPIYFVRHGESCYNLEDRIGGNPLLTEQGMRDAGALLEFLASLKEHLKHVDHIQHSQHAAPQSHHSNFHAHDDPAARGANTANTLEVWTSQLRRAIQTAELSERLLNIRTLRWSSLNEIHAGVCENMTYDEVTQRYPLIDYFRKRNKYTFRYPEGESYQDLVVRLEPVIMELENADKVVVVVAHQAVLRCLLAYFGSTSAESSISVEVPHRTVWRCTYDSKGIASLDELKLDNYEAGFQLKKPEKTPLATAATTATASCESPHETATVPSTAINGGAS